MPIALKLRKYYGAVHRAQRLALIAIHGAKCMECGELVPRYLNFAHPGHDPRRPARKLWCPACHNKHDAPHRLAIWRRNRAKRSGQLWLLPEIEYAPYPAWMIPRRVIGAGQGRLFA